MHLKFASIAILAAVIILSCSTVKEPETAAVGNYTNPNGSSELSLLMNRLYDEAVRVREQIARGEKPRLSKDAKKILTAAATEPDKVASMEYQVLAGSYIASVQQYNKAPRAEATAQFNIMATACLNCHNTLCPGPIRKIRKLLLE